MNEMKGLALKKSCSRNAYLNVLKKRQENCSGKTDFLNQFF